MVMLLRLTLVPSSLILPPSMVITNMSSVLWQCLEASHRMSGIPITQSYRERRVIDRGKIYINYFIISTIGKFLLIFQSTSVKISVESSYDFIILLFL